jgi:signal transduction histidine kinase/ActR/RegA family two-component response regulator
MNRSRRLVLLVLGCLVPILVVHIYSQIDRPNYRDVMATLGAAFIALILAYFAGYRLIHQPTEALLQATRRWQEGDLNARADIRASDSDLALLARSFNAMADQLQARAVEQSLQSTFLENRVAKRTQELSDTNNRLQVEIAGREKTEAALRQAQKLQAVGQLAGGVAHDFNNMLATIMGNLELMERRVAQAGDDWTKADADRLQHLIARATGAVTRGAQLTARLLAFSRRQPLTSRPTDVNALLQELITLASSTLGRRVQVAADLADDLYPALVDPSQLEAAILNLCLNARDAMPDGGHLMIQTRNITLQPLKELQNSEADLLPGSYIQICIGDTGTGMSADVRARAFDPFFTTKGPSQVYGMARQSGGGVTIESTPNAGTMVILSLPRAAAVGETRSATRTEPANRGAAEMAHPLVLVVDDDEPVRQVTVEMVRDLGCEVIEATSGDQTLRLLNTLPRPPNLILLDYAMPNMNGLQLARALRAHGVTAPIALVTGYAELSEVEIASDELTGLLHKPFTIRELRAMLQQLEAVPITEPQHQQAEAVKC